MEDLQDGGEHAGGGTCPAASGACFGEVLAGWAGGEEVHWRQRCEVVRCDAVDVLRQRKVVLVC